MSREGTTLHHTYKPMTNTELTLDQLQTIAGGGKEERQARRAARKAKREDRNILRQHKKRVKRGEFENVVWCSPNGPCL